MNERYKSALDLVKEQGRWGLYHQIIPLKPAERIDKIEEVLRIAAKGKDDESTNKLFVILMKAIDDIEVIPFTEDNDGYRVISGHIRKIEEARSRARSARVQKAKELFEKLSEKSEFSGYIGEVGPNVPKTKKAILKEIASWWNETKDETQADMVFSFLKDVFPHLRIPALEKDFLDVIRDATGDGFPTERLMRHFICLVPSDVPNYNRRCGAMANILKIAWARNSNIAEVAWIFRTVHPLLSSKKDRNNYHDYKDFEFVERLAPQVAELKKKVKNSRNLL